MTYDALNNAKRALENWIQLYPDSKDAIDVIALESIDKALAQLRGQGMSEQKMREALGLAIDLLRQVPDEYAMPDNPVWGLAREALAQQPVTAVELTDAEIEAVDCGMCGEREFALTFGRRVIAAHEAKKNGGAA